MTSPGGHRTALRRRSRGQGPLRIALSAAIVAAAGLVALNFVGSRASSAFCAVNAGLVSSARGVVAAVGSNGNGQDGDGSTTDRATPEFVSGLAAMRSITGGFTHSLSIATDCELFAWGQNQYGQLGDGTTTDRTTPVPLSTLSHDVVSTFAGLNGYSLAVRADGSVWSWGYNGFAELGYGGSQDNNAHPAPQPVPGASDIVAVAGGAYHVLALRSDGRVRSWGCESYGELGDGDHTAHCAGAQVVMPLSNIVSVAAGYQFSAALDSGGTVWVWGANFAGQQGDGTADHDAHDPTALHGLTVKALFGGSDQLFGLTAGGELWSWGYNNAGQLGDGSTTDHHTPEHITGVGGDIVKVAALWNSTWAVTNDGGLWSWGLDDHGQLADGSIRSGGCMCTTSPAATGVTGVKDISAVGFGGLLLE